MTYVHLEARDLYIHPIIQQAEDCDPLVHLLQPVPVRFGTFCVLRGTKFVKCNYLPCTERVPPAHPYVIYHHPREYVIYYHPAKE